MGLLLKLAQFLFCEYSDNRYIDKQYNQSIELNQGVANVKILNRLREDCHLANLVHDSHGLCAFSLCYSIE
jgi:hypothetical protein